MKRDMCLIAVLTGYLYFGQYYDSSLLDLEGRKVKYRAGIHIDLSVAEGTTLFVEDETLMTDTVGTAFKPGQINYKVGVVQDIWLMENGTIILQHECKHPVDGASEGEAAQSYNLIELRYEF